AAGGHADSPADTESWRVSPPAVSRTPVTPAASSSRSARSRCSPPTTHTTVSTTRLSRRTQRSSSGSPASSTNPLGIPTPSRSPDPAATTTALVSGNRRWRGLLGQELVDQLLGLGLVLLHGGRELGDQDLLRLGEHALLTRGQTLVGLAQREVPHDLGHLEDVARLELLVVGLEAARPVGGHRPVAAAEDLEDLLALLAAHHVAQPDL